MTLKYAIVEDGPSASFPATDGFRHAAVSQPDAEVIVALGGASARAPTLAAVLVELDNGFLADDIGLGADADTANVLGFCRYRVADDDLSQLIELARAPHTTEAAVDAARSVFEAAGFQVALCADQPGRIIDRLVRPKYNAALRLLDEGLASREDMDLTCRMGLGYPEGPLERVFRGGLARHHDITKALFDASGAPGYAPPRAAIVASRARGTSS